jgi:hypothetical protein
MACCDGATFQEARAFGTGPLVANRRAINSAGN